MKTVSRRLLLAFVLAVAAGTLLHFVYELFPSPVTALFSPMRESLWEHLKLLFYPYLAALLLLTRGGEPGCRAPWLLSLLTLCGVMLGAGYCFHILLELESMVFDIGLFVVLMAAGFFLLPRLYAPLAGRSGWTETLWVLTVLLWGAILIFGPLPPSGVLFADLSGAPTWAVIPW